VHLSCRLPVESSVTRPNWDCSADQWVGLCRMMCSPFQAVVGSVSRRCRFARENSRNGLGACGRHRYFSRGVADHTDETLRRTGEERDRQNVGRAVSALFSDFSKVNIAWEGQLTASKVLFEGDETYLALSIDETTFGTLGLNFILFVPPGQYPMGYGLTWNRETRCRFHPIWQVSYRLAVYSCSRRKTGLE